MGVVSLAVRTALLFSFGALAVQAGELTVRVTDADGKAVADAVVTVRPQEATPPAKVAARKPETRTIDQKDETFVPYVEIFRPGDQVLFRNSDKVTHHVYSFSPPKSFEFPIGPDETKPTLTLDKTGVAVIGCNIHDHMIAYLYVSDAPWMAKSGKDGVVTVNGLGVGNYIVQLWHPQMYPSHPEFEERVSLESADTAKSVAFSKIPLLPDPRANAGPERGSY